MGSKGSKKTTIGYRYSWDIQSGLGRGPVDELVEISADEKIVFAAKAGEVTGSTSFYIDKGDLFGGDDVGGEGGIRGTFEIAMGEPGQTASGVVRNLLGGLVPGFRGVVTTFFSGVISTFSASPKPWKFRVRRTVKGWDGETWYPEKVNILLSNTGAEIKGADKLNEEQLNNLRTIHAMNGAHILIEAATNRDWGRGASYDDIDLQSFKDAADQLYNEKFGLCFRYNRQDDLDSFIQQVLDHIGAVQWADMETGKLKLKLIRDDYHADDLPLFTYDNGIIEIQDDDSTTGENAPNEIVVTYRDPVTNSQGEVRAQNLGAIQAVGLISSTTDYPALPTHDLAARVAERDLNLSGATLSRLVIIFDRRGRDITPAGVFRISIPERGINNMILRAAKIEEQDNGSLKITAVQDVFSLPATSFSSGQQDSTWKPPVYSPQIINEWQLTELSWLMLINVLSTAELNALSEDAGFTGIMASAPSGTQIDYLIQSNTGSGWRSSGQGDWTPSLILTRQAGRLDTVLYVDFSVIPETGAGIIIDDELIRIDAIDFDAGTVTVGRACGDTVPAQHRAGAMAWIYKDFTESDNTEYLSGESVSVRLLTRTNNGTLAADDASVLTVDIQGRMARPYLPGNIAMNGDLYPLYCAANPENEYLLTWSHRDRILQSDRLIDCLSGNIGPETGVSYTVTVSERDTGETKWVFTTTGTSVFIPYIVDDEPDNVIHTVTLRAVRGELESFKRWSITLPAGHI